MPAKTNRKKSTTYTKRPLEKSSSEASAKDRWLSLGRATGRGLLASLLSLLLLCTAGAAAAFSSADPDALVTSISLGVMFLSALIGGLFAFRSLRRAPFVCGLLCGLCLLLASAFLGLFLPDALGDTWPTALRWGLRGGMLGFSVLGAVMGSYAPKKKKRKKR